MSTLSELSAAGNLQDSDLLLIRQSGSDRKISWGDLIARLALSDALVTHAVGDDFTDNETAFDNDLDLLEADGGGTLYVGPGIYRYTTSPNWARPGVHIYAAPGAIFKHTGTGNAFILDGGTSLGLYGLTYTNLTVQGNSSSTHGFYVRSIHHSRLVHPNVLGCATTGHAMHFEACLADTIDTPRCSTNEGTVSPLPLHGMYFTRKTTGGNVDSNANTIITPVMEGLTGGAGIYFDWANNNTIIAGTSEGNDEGIHYTENGKNNVVSSTHFEANSNYDIYLEGGYNEFLGINAAGEVFVTTGDGRENTFLGGRINQLTLDTDAAYNKILGITTGSAGGTLTDNGNHNVKFKNFDGANGAFYPDSLTFPEDFTSLALQNPVSPTADTSNYFLWSGDNTFAGVAVTVAAPSNPQALGQRITITIKNASGGALGTFTWNAQYKMGAAWTNPANGFNRSIDFVYTATNTWTEVGRTAADVAN